MTKPVAWRVDGTIYNDIKDAEYAVIETEHLRNEIEMDNSLIRKPVYIEPLYTAEQLHPRVKMTKEQADNFKTLHAEYDLLSDGLNAIYGIEYLPMKKWIVNGKIRENEIKIASIWGSFDADNPEETIDIVPYMKWFVRSKEPEDELQDFIFLSGSNLDDLDYLVFDYARAFDTKEEAELWTNPLTEAVQLPVEGE